METQQSIRASLIPGEWVSFTSPSTQTQGSLPQISGVSFLVPPFWPNYGLEVFTMIVKEVKKMAFTRGVRQYIDNWLIRAPFREEGQVKTQTVIDLTFSLGWIINLEKSKLKPTQVFLFMDYEYHLDSAPVKPTQERCLMSLIGLLASIEKMVPEGCLHFRPLQYISRSTGDILSHLTAFFLGQDHFRSPSMVAKPSKCDEGCRPSPQRPEYSNLYRHHK